MIYLLNSEIPRGYLGYRFFFNIWAYQVSDDVEFERSLFVIKCITVDCWLYLLGLCYSIHWRLSQHITTHEPRNASIISYLSSGQKGQHRVFQHCANMGVRLVSNEDLTSINIHKWCFLQCKQHVAPDLQAFSMYDEVWCLI